MIDPASQGPPAKRRFWIIGLIVVVVAAIVWFSAPLETGKKTAPVQPAARSTDWAPVPTGPAVPLTLPKTPMTNAPAKAP